MGGRLMTARLSRLANNLFGNGLFEAGLGLNGQPARYLLGILKYIERIDFAPSHSNNMKTAVEVGGVAIQQGSPRIPLHKHLGVPRPALHPDIVDLDVKDRQDGMTRRHYLAATGAAALGLGARGALAQQVISGIKLPDSQIAREATELVRQHEPEILFNHSVRVYLFGAMKRSSGSNLIFCRVEPMREILNGPTRLVTADQYRSAASGDAFQAHLAGEREHGPNWKPVEASYQFGPGHNRKNRSSLSRSPRSR
jgi:hypothetical protein